MMSSQTSIPPGSITCALHPSLHRLATHTSTSHIYVPGLWFKSLTFSQIPELLHPESPSPQQPLPDVHKGAVRSNKSKVTLKEVSIIPTPTSPLLPHYKSTAQPILEPVWLPICFSRKKPKQSTQKNPKLAKIKSLYTSFCK